MKAMTVKFWGVHGTLPVPGARTVRYGGNTSCVSVELDDGGLFIFDAGSGIKNLSDRLSAGGGAISATIFISHPHWDHINALPFFAPLYGAEHEFRICGPAQGERDMEALLSAQMDSVFFPVTMKEFKARVSFENLTPGVHRIGGAEVRAERLVHQGICLGYRVNYRGRSLCYMTDNELFPEGTPEHSDADRARLLDFADRADMLIADCTYFDEEYPAKRGWGHSSLGEVAEFAHRARVKTLYLFHHDPAHGDDEIDDKLVRVRRALAEKNSQTACVAPKELDSVEL